MAGKPKKRAKVSHGRSRAGVAKKEGARRTKGAPKRVVLPKESKRAGKRVAKSAGKGGVGTRRVAGPSRKRGPLRSITREIARKDRAIDALGSRVRRGGVSLSSTGRLTPTRRGFRAVEGVADAVRALQKKPRRAKAYSFQLSIRYRDARGRFVKLQSVEGTFPLPAALKRAKKRGESEASAFKRITSARIKGAVFRAIDHAEGVAVYTPAVERALASGDREKIARAMRAFKARRGVSFKVKVIRHVIGQVKRAKSPKPKAKAKRSAVPRRTR